MNKFQIYDMNIINEQILDDDIFYLNIHCELEEINTNGGEAFIVKVVSPKYLESIIDSNNPIELGRGYIIAKYSNLKFLKEKLQGLIDRFNSKDWEDLYQKLERYFDWIE